MTLLSALALVVGGAVAGVINTVAGGGSLLTLPLLIFGADLSAADANGTNRVGVAVQSAVATRTFGAQGRLAGALDAGDIAAACVGAAIGALGSLPFDEAALRRVMGVVLLGMLGLLLAQPTSRLASAGVPSSRPVRAAVYLAIGLYGGFVQAGVGVVLALAGVIASGRDLVEANVAKVAIVLAFTVPALVVFAATGHVAWGAGALLALGAAAGGWIGARVTAAWAPGALRAVLVVAVSVSAARLLL